MHATAAGATAFLVIVELRKVRQAGSPWAQGKVQLLSGTNVLNVVLLHFLPCRILVAHDARPQFKAGVLVMLGLRCVREVSGQVLQLVAGERADGLSHQHGVDDLGFAEGLEAVHDSAGTQLAEVELLDVLPHHHIAVVQQRTELSHNVLVITDAARCMAGISVVHLALAVVFGSEGQHGPVVLDLVEPYVLVEQAPHVSANGQGFNVSG